MAIDIKEYNQILYIDSSKGSDDNDGSKLKPFKTISQCLSIINTTSALIYLKGEFIVEGLASLSLSNYEIAYVGYNESTKIIINSKVLAFKEKANFYNMIITFSDKSNTPDFWTDTLEVTFNNVLFLAGKNMTGNNRVIFNQNYNNVYINTNKKFNNCTCNMFYAWVGLPTLNNCVTSQSTFMSTAKNEDSHLTEYITDSKYSVVFDDKFKISENNNLYGIYSGDNKWKEIRFLIKDGESYKTYDTQSKQLVDFTDDISEILNDNSESTFITNLNDIKDLVDLTSGIKIISNSSIKSKIKTIKSTKQLFIGSGDFSTKLAEHIDYFKFSYSLSDENCIIKIAISIDSGKSWYSYQNDNWTKLDNKAPLKDYDSLSDDEKTDWNNLLDEVLEKGIKVQDETESLDFNTLNLEKARFAYAIQVQDANSEVILKDLKWQFDSIGSYSKLKTEVNISMTNNAISIQPLKDIELMKINVGISSNKFDINSISDEDLKKFKEKINNV